MTQPSMYRVFISAVSGELGSCRREVARVLRRKGLEVRDEHFPDAFNLAASGR